MGRIGILNTAEYTVLGVDQTYIGMSYSDLIQDWHNWVFSQNPDDSIDPDLTYLRGDMLGDPIYPELLGLKPSGFEVVEDVRTVYDRTRTKGLTITDQTGIFFPVYGSMFVVGDHYKDKKLETTNECRLNAREEFKLVTMVWAVFRPKDGTARPVLWNGNGEKQNLFRYYAECTPFTLSVSAGNRVNREAGYYLQGPKEYDAVGVGIFLLMYGFKADSEFQLDFGGLSGREYNTRAVYDITVVPGRSQDSKERSEEITGRPYPPKKKIEPAKKEESKEENKQT